jgi:hypothetical protein
MLRSNREVWQQALGIFHRNISFDVMENTL